ncbi:MAG: twin-arginine translocase subunit TatC [Planctomycetes bacterium]|nr:twin-arginine translocase subunit TatC [Planctomycetota bacterium]
MTLFASFPRRQPNRPSNKRSGKVFGGAPKQAEPAAQPAPEQIEAPSNARTIIIGIRAKDLARLLHELDPDRYPAELAVGEDRSLSLPISAPEFAEFRQTTENQRRPVTLNVQEAFMTYLKVSGVAGLVLASPWIFYQLWLFVAAGLYRHERQFVYKYLPISVGLFLGGALFCFFVVFPFILRFLLGFNKFLGLLPQIRISEWINFAIMLPLMFGISFQLPLIMLFLERISVFDADDYREKRRLAILVISVLSMLLTPSDPGSMIAMMLPLLALYELGIWMCTRSPSRKNPFAEEA